MNPAPIPWILWNPGSPPDSTGEFLGSTATIRSEIGVGTTVTLHLPRSRTRDEDATDLPAAGLA